MTKPCVIALAACLVSPLIAVPTPARAQNVIESNTSTRPRDVIFVPTREPIAEAMMRLANVTKDDVVYDLGCGDGALVIAAAKRGARAVGVDIDPDRIKEATEKVRAAGVQDRVTLIRGDIFDPTDQHRRGLGGDACTCSRASTRSCTAAESELKKGRASCRTRSRWATTGRRRRPSRLRAPSCTAGRFSNNP